MFTCIMFIYYFQNHYHQAVFLLNEDMSVNKGDVVGVTGRIQDGYMDIQVNNAT